MLAGISPEKLLSWKLTVVREGRRQITVGNGPESEAEGRLMAVTVVVVTWQVIPVQLHGLSSLEFQPENTLAGSVRVVLSLSKSRPSWFNE